MEFRFIILVLIVNQVLGLGIKSHEKSQSHVALDDTILSLLRRNPLEESPRIANLMYQHGILPYDGMLMKASAPLAVNLQQKKSDSPAVIPQKPASIVNDINDAEISLWLSKMSDEQLLDILRDQPDKKEYNINDLMEAIKSDKETENKKAIIPDEINKLMKVSDNVIVVDQLIPLEIPYKASLSPSNYQPVPKPVSNNYEYITRPRVSNHREINGFGDKVPQYNENYQYINSDVKKPYSDQHDLLKENIALKALLDKIVRNQDQERIAPKPENQQLNLWENMGNIPPGIVLTNGRSHSEANIEKLDYNLQKDKELLFDALVSTLKTLCCTPDNKRSEGMRDDGNTVMLETLPPFMQLALMQMKNKGIAPQVSRRINDEKELSKPQEQLFLVLNEEIPSNGTDELVTVDPDSLNSNSTVLPLGPITDDLNDADLKIVMNKVSNELRKDEYKELISQLSKGINNGAVPGTLMLDSEVTRRYFKPHRCHHRSQLSRISGSSKWLVCTGYIGFNKPSIYDG